MAKVIVVVGFGPGISAAVADKFGAEGFSVALVGRNEERLEAGAKALVGKGVKAAAFAADVASTSGIPALFDRVRASLGPITALHWNAYAPLAGDLLTADAAAIHGAFDVAVTALVVAVQAALPDLRKAENPAVLVTNGAFGRIDTAMDAIGVQYGSMGLSVANAAKDKLVGLLSEKLKPEGIYVGQLMIAGLVKGSAFDQGNANLDPRAIADRFWSLYQSRTEVRTQFA